MNETREAWIALNLLPEISPTVRARLVEACGSPLGVLGSSRAALRNVRGVRTDIIDKLADFDWKSSVSRELEKVHELGIQVITPADAGYPAKLLEIYDPPPALYVRGSFAAADERAVAIVGSRRATHYGLEAAREFGRDLAAQGVTVVSGLALGADAAAHRGALEAGGRTLAVLGSSLDRPYPRRNLELLEEVVQSGAVISEFPLGTDPLPFHFPRRNRVIAGLALGTVVVEASARSGSLVTARMALEAGREVFAVPGRITSDRSLGTNFLIRAGHARLVQCAADVLEELPGQTRRNPAEPEERPEAAPPPGLPEDEAALLARIDREDPVPVDTLVEASKLELGAVLNALLSLEMRRLIRSVPGGRYIRLGPDRSGTP